MQLSIHQNVATRIEGVETVESAAVGKANSTRSKDKSREAQRAREAHTRKEDDSPGAAGTLETEMGPRQIYPGTETGQPPAAPKDVGCGGGSGREMTVQPRDADSTVRSRML